MRYVSILPVHMLKFFRVFQARSFSPPRILSRIRQPLATMTCVIMAMVLSSILPFSANAAYEQLANIRKTVQGFIEREEFIKTGKAVISVGQLDPRLQLNACDKALEVFLLNPLGPHGNTTAGVRCDSPKPWTLYVPVQIKNMVPVVVLAHALPRGTPIGSNDIRVEERDILSLTSGYFDDPNEVLGKTLYHTLPAGSALNKVVVQATAIVRRGQRVTLLAQIHGVEVRMAGEALSNGAIGDLIRVRNTTSRRIVEGVVTDNGTVSISL